MSIGIKIKKVMKEKNISQKELIEITKINQSTMSDIINDKSENPKLNTIKKIAEGLGVLIDDIC